MSDLDRVQFLLTPHRVRQSVAIRPFILLFTSGAGVNRFAEVVQRHSMVILRWSLTASSGETWSTAVE